MGRDHMALLVYVVNEMDICVEEGWIAGVCVVSWCPPFFFFTASGMIDGDGGCGGGRFTESLMNCGFGKVLAGYLYKYNSSCTPCMRKKTVIMFDPLSGPWYHEGREKEKENARCASK